MNITEIKIRKIYAEGAMKALVSITIDNKLAIHDIKIIGTSSGQTFIAMPSRKESNGKFRDIVHPIGIEARKNLEELILKEYYQVLNNQPSKDEF